LTIAVIFQVGIIAYAIQRLGKHIKMEHSSTTILSIQKIESLLRLQQKILSDWNDSDGDSHILSEIIIGQALSLGASISCQQEIII